MQDTKRNAYPANSQGTILKALSICLVALFTQACQTTPLTPDEWNAQTNAVNAFSNSAYLYGQSQRPTYRQQYQQPAYQQRQPAYYQAPYQPQVQPEAPLWGQGSLFNQ